jgi:hypothetical protein
VNAVDASEDQAKAVEATQLKKDKISEPETLKDLMMFLIRRRRLLKKL